MIDKVRRKLILAAVGLGAASLFGLSKARKLSKEAVIKSTVTADAKLGINLSSIEYWGTEFPFIDLFKQSHVWILEGGLSNDLAAQLDTDGWITTLVKGQKAIAIISSVDNCHFPNGDYVVLYDGEGDINIPNQLIQTKKPGRLSVQVNGGKGGLKLEIVKTNAKNYIRNIRFVPKAYEKNYGKMHWNPSFIERWSGVSCLRFMDFMRTNNSEQITWQDRPHPSDASFVKNGVPVEWMVDLANKLNCDAWFCMPHQANDDYVKAFAQVVEKSLKPELQAWVEYSNEVWNGSFKQHKYAVNKGRDLNLIRKKWDSAFKFNAYRSIEIFKIWKNVFGESQRLVRVIASQSANVWLSEQLLKIPELAASADVLAIAPYVSFHVSPNADDKNLDAAHVASWSLEKLFQYLETVAMPESMSAIESNQKVAMTYGLKLVAYEGGQHLIGVRDAKNNNKLTRLLISANKDERMGNIYTRYLKGWERAGGGLFCHYNSTGEWTKWGSWSLTRGINDKATPKLKAVVTWAKSLGQKMKF